MNMKVIILGSQGFVGKVLSRKLLNLGYDVTLIDILDDVSIEIANKYLKIDLLSVSEDKLSYLFDNSVVIHLAALSTSDACERDLDKALDLNLKVTIKVAKAVNKVNARLIFASSEWVYPDSDSLVENMESDVLSISQSTNFYAMTKLVGEWIVNRYAKSFTILRFGIVYGERIIPQGAIESIVHQVLADKVVELGSPETSRRFIHVEDLCDGILKVIEKTDTSNGTFNLAGNEIISLEKIINQLGKERNQSVKWTTLSKKPSVRNAISKKFYETFKWEPDVSLRTGIIRLIEYYQELNSRR